jgi:hypothetical protein
MQNTPIYMQNTPCWAHFQRVHCPLFSLSPGRKLTPCSVASHDPEWRRRIGACKSCWASYCRKIMSYVSECLTSTARIKTVASVVRLRMLASRLRNTAQPNIVAQQQIARMQRLLFKIRTVTGNDKPMPDLVSEQFNSTERRELPAESLIGWIGGFRKNEPDAIVSGGLGSISQHQDEPVAQVDCETGEHPAHLRVEGRKRLHNERIRWLPLRLGRTEHPS